MPLMSISDFSRIQANYDTDEGTHAVISVRSEYINKLPSCGLTSAVAAPVAGSIPFKGKPRHLYISALNTIAAGNVKLVRRKVPFMPGALAALEAAVPAATIDGLTPWAVHGHTGERTRH